MRILSAIDYAALSARPKAIIGFSDITALHGAIRAKAGIVSFHGPTGRGELTEFSRRSLEAALVRGDEPCGSSPHGETLVAGKATGVLAGGNLALLASLAGTPYFPDLDGAILVLEDVNEPVYRIDRMLLQLRLSGLLKGVAGLIFGSFTDRGSEEKSLPLETVIAETAASLGVPSMCGAPIGHIADQWTLPLGARAELDSGARRLTMSS
jgi:muramoyltetrapeptide carboxypeptidase